jgi:transposase-like protein
MGRKAKFSYEDKLKACEDYINSIASVSQIAESLGVKERIVFEWINKYRIRCLRKLIPQGI